MSAGAAGFTLDEELGVTALTGCVFATLAWLEGVDDPRVEIRVDTPSARTLKAEVVQRMAPVPADAVRYLRDADSVPPSDLAVALGLGAGHRIAALNGGAIEVTPIAGGGSIIQTTLSKPAAN